MATRMSMRCVVGSVLTIAGLGTCTQAQYLYAGPGAVVQGQVNGPFVYNSYGYPYLAPGSYLSGPVLVPVPNPYLHAPPVVIPPQYGYGYAPNFYRPRLPLPQVPYGGYQPRPRPPTSASPTASPNPSPQVARPKSLADQRPPSTVRPPTSAPRRPDVPPAPRPPAPSPASGQVPPASSTDSKSSTSPDPNKPAENLPR